MGYRIDSVEIEGFKGFTKSQTIRFDGKPVFIFGENAKGKSSIVEAIVWCLFGAVGGESNVRNRLYNGGAGDCTVTLHLHSDDKGDVSIERRMRRGSGESDGFGVVSGRRVYLTELFPQLDKLGHGPGATVIFADQEPGRRHIHDMKDFESLIAAYLGLHVVLSLVKMLRNERSEQMANHKVLLQRYQGVRKELEEVITPVRINLNGIMKTPPWETATAPTDYQTLEKAKSLLREVAILTQTQEEQISGLTATKDILDTAENLLNQAETSQTNTNNLIKNLEATRDLIVSLKQNLDQSMRQLELTRSIIRDQQEKLSNILSSHSVAEIDDELERLTQKNRLDTMHLDLLKEAEEFCKVHGFQKCPVCDSAVDSVKIRTHLTTTIASYPADLVAHQARIQQLKSAQATIADLKRNITSHQTTFALYESQKNTAESNLRKTVQESGSGEVVAGSVESQLQSIGSRITQLRSHQNDNLSVIAQFRRKLQVLRSEHEYHKLKNHMERLEKYRDSKDFHESEKDLRSIEIYLDNMKLVADSLDNIYHTFLLDSLPPINNEMSAVYQALTKQQSFPHLELSEEQVQKDKEIEKVLTLSVLSSDKTVRAYPEDVLNGQAKSAINLVPYFTFSNLEMLRHEIDFLLIDDPSQSFDTSHVSYLMKLLSNTAIHAQVVVASHEEARFRTELAEHFKNRKEVLVSGFNPESGPKIEEI